jgi:flagellar biosynthesis/type III secretory pathway M-ring protein FliF/YscJ
MENKIKHLEMIENVIERMAKNSFQLKGWAMTLVAIVGALGAKDADKRFIILAFIPIIVFWLLDSMYLQTERRYKALYREVTEKKEEEIDFNLNTRNVEYTEREAKDICFCKCLFSFSEILFYGALAVAFIALVVILKVW